MKIRKKQFEKELKGGKLALSLIGMSNIGKTYWSNKLRSAGFEHYNCDAKIEERLSPLLSKLGYEGIEGVSRWMGQPYDKRFARNQKKYLALEKEVAEEIMDKIRRGGSANIIVDTTGSVVHTGRKVYTKLKRHTLVVYIKAPESMKEEMFRKYLKKPKPVIFGNVYRKNKNETRLEALRRCYRKLLERRSDLYAKYADIVIKREDLEENISAEKFISVIKKSL